MSKKLEIAKAIAMMNQMRFVNIRGYIREVRVCHASANENNEWVVKDKDKIELVPEHLFYHRAPGGLILRDSPEFKRKYAFLEIYFKNTPDYASS